MKKIFYRQNRLFCIDDSQLSEKAKTLEVKNALYTAVAIEFRGAVEKDEYKNLTYSQKMDKLNIFANKWLEDRGLN